MADVIITGMEMPVDCYSCDIRFGFACPAKEGKRIQQVYARPDWCPLRSVPEWHDVADPPKRYGLYYVIQRSAYGDFQSMLYYSATDGWFEYDSDYGDEFGILEHDDVVWWHDLPEPPEGGDGDA
jgi:hypothetical protein